MMERVVQSRGAGAQGDGSEGRVVNCEGVEARGVGDRFYNYFHIFQLQTRIKRGMRVLWLRFN